VFTTSTSTILRDLEIFTDAVMFAKAALRLERRGSQSADSEQPTDSSKFERRRCRHFGLQDVTSYIDEQLGKLERTQSPCRAAQ